MTNAYDETDRQAVTTPAEPLTLEAFRVGPENLIVEPAPVGRDWMDHTDRRFARRCLPLLIANQSGWLLRQRHRLRVMWNGGARPEDVHVEYLSGAPPWPAASHFGSGIITWHIPWLFRTPPGWNLLVRGPSNWPKDGAAPLEGLVETDWTVATFTMNWLMTRPHEEVVFDDGEAIGMILPQRRGELEGFRAVIKDGDSAPEIARAYEAWKDERTAFLRELKIPGSAAARTAWQRDYFKGAGSAGSARDHRAKAGLSGFVRS